MTYGDLPTVPVCQKLVMVSFDSPQKNLSVYRFTEALRPHQSYIENEKLKLLERLGSPDENHIGRYKLEGQDNINEYSQKLTALLSMEIGASLPAPGVTAEDFFDEKCCYPSDKSLWLSAADIASILEFSNKQKKEHGV